MTGVEDFLERPSELETKGSSTEEGNLIGVEKSKDVEGTLYSGLKLNLCTPLFVSTCLYPSATGKDVGNLAVIPKSKVGSGTCFPAPNSYARQPVDSCLLCGCGVASGVGGNSKLNVCIFVFS